uniref:Prion-like-(Q/N-rich) domain-bearing protein 8 n=1 Tax=Nicotiana sylvestris TaxID=4096 RepID=A0A1U7YFB9_NICSY|nr:PREDICTED: prion-like-(Q/N-rich) domain-bearing protein 8 [Nicotiana sylvestris]
MEGVNMMVNKRRQRGQKGQGNPDQFEQSGNGCNQDDVYDDQCEEVQYVKNYQGQRGNAPNHQQQWRSQGNWGNQNQQGIWNNGNNNNQSYWGTTIKIGGNWGSVFQRPPMFQQPNNPPTYPSRGPSSSNNEMGWIESMFEQIMKKNADFNAKLASYNTSIRNLEVQLGKISQALNTRPKGALPSNMVVNSKGGNNTGHAMAVTTKSGRGGIASTSNARKVVSYDVLV